MKLVIPEKRLTTEEVAEMLNVTKRTVESWRSTRRGPKYFKLGCIRYREEDVLAWLAATMVDPSKMKDKPDELVLSG